MWMVRFNTYFELRLSDEQVNIWVFLVKKFLQVNIRI